MDSSGQKTISDRNGPDFYPLKWHKFLIWFSLWAGAVLNVINGFRYMTGAVYGPQTDAVYLRFPGVKTVDIVMGLVLITLAAYMIFVRFSLARFRTGAPGRLVAVYLITGSVSLVYVICVSSATGFTFGELTDVSFWSNLIGSVFFAFVNRIYYGKRAELFVY